MIDEKGLEEMHAAGSETFGSSAQINALHNQGPTDSLIDEDEFEATLGEPAVDEHLVLQLQTTERQLQTCTKRI
jgi:hypothetical protein